MNKTSRIYIAGHKGLVGSALYRHLSILGYEYLITADHAALDLTRQADVMEFFQANRPEYVFLAAAKVGGILANERYPAEFIHDNLAIQNHVIESAYRSGVSKLLFLGSSCIYPRLAPQPLKEEYLLTGPLEPTNQWYAIAKIAGIKLCQAYRRQYGFNTIALMPTNLYGPGDNFDPETSHVLPALIRKFDTAWRVGADQVEVWGTGTPRREFLYVDDLADAAVFLMQHYDREDIINVGTGVDVTVSELAEQIKSLVGFTGQIYYDTTKPDGTPCKRLDVTRLNQTGWQAKTSLEQGLRRSIQWYQSE
ncbi:MAG: GDP-L-fucose synthase family protein [Methylococcaceae bacterium]